MRIRLANPVVDSLQEQAVIAVLRSGNLVAGANVARFEQKLCAITGRDHAIALSSGTAALIAGMHALGIGQGSVVLVPALTFPAPALAAAFLGARVRVCDVDPETMNLSGKTLLEALDDDVSLVVPIDQFGNPAPMPEIESICASRGIPVFVDAACSLGSSLGERPCGSTGRASIFSFHPRKVVTTCEGGALLTDDADLAARVRLLRNLGMENGCFASLGINLRPSEVGAAMGLIQLERLAQTVARRNALANRYRRLPLLFQRVLPGAISNIQTMATVLSSSLGSNARESLMETLSRDGIETRIASYCIPSVPALRERLGLDKDAAPCAAVIHDRGIALPLHIGLSDDEVDEVVVGIENWLRTQGG